MQVAKENKSAFFEGINQNYNSEYDVKLPIFYYDTLSFTAVYTASTKELKALLPSSGMHPVEIFPGRCLISLSAFEYKDTDIGPYNELSVAAVISFQKKRPVGFSAISQVVRNSIQVYMLSLPVTTERARKGGAELCGYPKFITEIEFSDDSKNMTCVVSSNGNRLLTFRGKKMPTRKGPKTHAKVFTELNQIPLSSNLYINPIHYHQSYGKGKASLNIGKGHELCDLLTGLKLSKEPFMYQYCPKNEAILFDSKNIMDI